MSPAANDPASGRSDRPIRGFRSGVPSRPLAYGVLLGIAVLVAGTVVARGQAGYSVSETGQVRIQDFASHLVFTRGVWLGQWRGAGAGSAYSVVGHLHIMSEWTGTEITEALPFGYAPTMLWLLLPLCLLPVPVAYACWALLSALGGAWTVSSARMHGLLGLMAFLVPVSLGAMALGQTGILGTAGAWFLARRSLDSRDPYGATWLEPVGLAIVLWALSAKPPLAVAAGVALLGTGRSRAVVGAAILSVVTAALATPWLGTAWAGDYLHLVANYDRVNADAAFAWSLVPEHMSNLRSFLSVDLGVADDRAATAGNLLWLASSALCVAAGRCRWLDPARVWGLAILSYLLFCSHVSSTDELLLIVVPATVASWDRGTAVPGPYVPWIVVVVGLLLSPALGPAEGVRPSPLWILELVLAVWVLASRPRGQRTALPA